MTASCRKNIQNHLNKVTELTNDIKNIEKPGAELDDNWNFDVKNFRKDK
jgi:hypothetical protein